MKLERRFDWNDFNAVYKRIDEDTVEKIPNSGMVRFIAIRVQDLRCFSGAGYPATIAEMVDTPTGYFGLAKSETPNKQGVYKSIVVAKNPPSTKSARTSEKA